MLNKRTNIFFDDELWKKLAVIAEGKKTSVGQLVRTAVAEKYTADIDLAKMRLALESIEKIRPQLKGKVDYKELISYGRE